MDFLNTQYEAAQLPFNLEAAKEGNGEEGTGASIPAKAGLWEYLAGVEAPAGRPQYPTLVKVATLDPEGRFYRVVVEVETEPWAPALKQIKPRPPASHYVLT